MKDRIVWTNENGPFSAATHDITICGGRKKDGKDTWDDWSLRGSFFNVTREDKFIDLDED